MNSVLFRGLSAAVLASVALSPLAAQETTTAATTLRFVPADAGLVLQLDGPGKLRETFGETNLVRMLTSEAFGEAWGTLLEEAGFDEAMDEMLTESGVDMNAMLEQLRDYRGRVVVGLRMNPLSEAALEQLDPSSFEDSGSMESVMFEGTRFLLTVVVGPDGETDLAAMADLVAERLREASDDDADLEVEEIEIGDTPGLAVVMPDTDGVYMLVPTLIDGHLVMAMGADLESELTGLREGDGFVAADDAASSGVALDISARLFEPLWQIAGGGMAGSMAMMMPTAAGPAEMADMLKQNLRLEGLRGLTVRVRPEGEHLVTETVIASDAQLPSMIRDVLRPELKQLDLLSLVPRAHSEFTATAIDLGAVVDMITDLVTDLGVGDAEMMESEFRNATGYDLRADLIDRLDGQVVFFNDMAMNLDDQDAFGIPSFSLLVGTQDSAGMAAMIGGLIRDNGMQPMLKTREYRGVEVTTLNAGLVAVDYAFVDGALLLGLGRFGAENLGAVIDRKLAGDGAEAKWPEAVQRRIELLAGGWRGLSVSGSGGALDPNTVGGLMASDSEGMSPELEGAFAEMVRLVQDFDLATSVTGTWIDNGQVRMRTIN